MTGPPPIAVPMPVPEGVALALAGAGRDLLALGRLDLARRAIGLALEACPDLPAAFPLLATLDEQEGAFDAALEHWRQAARLVPDSAAHRFNLSLALMTHGRLAEGLPLYESRLDRPSWTSLSAGRSLDAVRHLVPRPDTRLEGRRVLAFTEQGLGDCIWAARWLPALAARCGHLALACRPVLLPLLRTLPGIAEVIAPPEDQRAAKLNLAALAERFDHVVPLMSLPHLLGAGTDGGAYLSADPARTAWWRDRFRTALPEARRIVGVVWRASPDNGSSAARSFDPRVLAVLAASPGLGVVNLQGGPVAGREALGAVLPGSFDALAGGEPPLDDYAAAVAATDLLITVDTMAAHLAGALGHPAWVAVPAVPNFFWEHGRTDCRWYGSLRLFRQAPGRPWTEVGEAIGAALGG